MSSAENGTPPTPPSRPPLPAPPARCYLADLAPGDGADAAFIISNVQLKTNRKGDPYLTMLVSDRSAGVNANWWDQGQAMFERLPNPGVVRLKGTIELYNGHPQVKVDKILQIRDESTIDYADLLPSTDKDRDELFAEVAAMLRDMASPTLRRVAEAYLADGPLMADFRAAPAAMTFHHAYLGGLLEHTHNAMRSARALAPLYPGLNADLCLLGVFVHDLAKTWELSYATAFDYTDGGRLIGHVAKGAIWVEAKGREAGAPRAVIDALQHVVLSHHGELSLGFGSATSPATPEAIFVHHVENLDAKMTMALAATRAERPAGEPGRWSPWNKALGGRMFKPDVVAEADADADRPDLSGQDQDQDEAPAAPAAPAAAPSGTTNQLFADAG